MTRVVILLAWWFVLVSGPYRVTTTIGPFQTQERCDHMRSWIQSQVGEFGQPSWCWWDGKA